MTPEAWKRSIERRLQILERAVGRDELARAEREIVAAEEDACASGDHAWAQIDYDLQGGKWGNDRCRRCGTTRSWHA